MYGCENGLESVMYVARSVLKFLIVLDQFLDHFIYMLRHPSRIILMNISSTSSLPSSLVGLGLLSFSLIWSWWNYRDCDNIKCSRDWRGCCGILAVDRWVGVRLVEGVSVVWNLLVRFLDLLSLNRFISELSGYIWLCRHLPILSSILFFLSE